MGNKAQMKFFDKNMKKIEAENFYPICLLSHYT